MTKIVEAIIVGGGSRGIAYSRYALDHPEQLKIVGIAEPRDEYRQRFASAFNLTEDRIFNSWEELAQREKIADAVLICTQDDMHTDPAVAFANKGYNILLEKPMSPSLDDCKKIVSAAKVNNVMLSVCHVLRYTRYTRVLKAMLNKGVIGDVISMQHLEPVGYWHQAHAFVRGNWRKEKDSSFMLMAKSCHDMDWIHYIMGEKCKQVSSFGGLTHFRKESQPAEASDRCIDCKIESDCPYSAKRIYLSDIYAEQNTNDVPELCVKDAWPWNVLAPAPTEETILKALRDGPYGRCVYDCDNDVVDHQVVNLMFESGKTASFTMTAFTEMTERKTRIFGTHGCIESNSETIEIQDFRTNTREIIEVSQLETDSDMKGHGGGDYYLMKAFVEAIANNDGRKILSDPDETLESHLIVFAAEKSRIENRVVFL